MKHGSAAIRDERQTDWFYLDDRLIDLYAKQIGPAGIATYAALARHAKASGQAIVAYSRLAADIGATKNTAIAALRKLADAGLITIEQQTDEAGNPIGANIYTLCVIPQQKRQRAQRGVPNSAPPVPNSGTPLPEFEPPVPESDWGVPNSAYKVHDSISNQSDPPPPPPNPPAPAARAGGGGGSEHPTETQRALVRFGFSARSAARFRDLPLDVVQAELKAARQAGTGPGGLVERWKVDPPGSAPPARAAPSAPVRPTRIERPPDVLSPQDAARVLNELRKKQQEIPHG